MKAKLLFYMLAFAAFANAQTYQWAKNKPDGSEVNVNATIQQRATAKDFTVTFTNGTKANLFTTLTAGNSVMLDFFFTTWQYCQGNAPTIEQSYKNHGSGSGNIKYWGIDDKNENNATITAYMTQYGITNPCAGKDGGGNAAAALYEDGSMGTFSGDPTYAVVCPNKTVNWDVNYPATATGFDTYFTGCGTTGIIDWNPTTTKFTTIYPNPATEKTTLDFYLDKPSLIIIEITNIQGQKVFEVSKNDVVTGFNYITVYFNNFNTGIYFVKLLQDNQIVDSRKLSVIK
jgi:hypothetical protein